MLTLFAVADSSVAIRNVSSGTCTKNLAHLLGIWFYMLGNRPNMKYISAKRPRNWTLTNRVVSLKIQDPMIPPIYSLPFAPHWTTIASISRRGLPHDVYSIYSGRNTPTLESISWGSSTGIFLSSPIGTPAAGWIFELRIHQLLIEKQTIQLFPLCPPGAGEPRLC